MVNRLNLILDYQLKFLIYNFLPFCHNFLIFAHLTFGLKLFESLKLFDVTTSNNIEIIKPHQTYRDCARKIYRRNKTGRSLRHRR